jgi:hypothetical protein
VRCRSFRAYGLAVESGFALPGVATAPGEACGPLVSVRLAPHDEVSARWSGACAPADWETVLGDGIALRHEVGVAGDQRFVYGANTFLITADAGAVLCSPEDPDDPGWQRQLLDTVLFTVSFAQGFELLHASAVEVDDGIVAFVAPSGGGKSSLAAELCRRGHPIVCDDVLAVGTSGAELVGHPGPAVMSVPSSGSGAAGLAAGVIARFEDEDELWVVLGHVAVRPGPLRAVYVLDRAADDGFVSKIAAPTVLDLLPHAISLPHDAGRARRRFALFSALAEQIEMFELGGAARGGPSALADLVERSFDDLPTPLAVR